MLFRSFRAEVDGVDHGDIHVLHLVDEVLDGGERRLGVARAAVERCAVIQAEFAAEVEHREAVGEDEELVRRGRAEVGKARVECFDLRAVVITVRAVEILVCGIGLADRVADGAAEDDGVFRRRPDVLVVFDLVAVVLIF